MRVSECAGASSPCARGVRSPGSRGDSATRSASPAGLRCGDRSSLARTLAALPPSPHRGAAGLGASLRSSSSPGLLRLWPRARPRAGCDCPGQIAPRGEPWRPYLAGTPCPRCNLGGEAARESAAAQAARLPVRRGRTGWPWPGTRVWMGAGSWPEPKGADVVGHRSPHPTCRGVDFGAGRKRRKGVSRRMSVRP